MNRILLSVVVIVYDMPRQALNTLYSLSTNYQQNVDADTYEVIVVENRSHNIMDQAAIAKLDGNFRYFLRDEQGVSPAAAINFALSHCEGEHICLMIDGARLVTPGVIHYSLMACKITPNALVVVPGYHLGPKEHHLLDASTYSETQEQEALRQAGWPQSGYSIFSMSCFSGGNHRGFFHPFMECNCLVTSKQIFLSAGGADERFNLPGGGALNLFIYRKLAMHPESVLFVLPGEGSFHQQHGGVTTSHVDARESLLVRQRDQLNAFLDEPFKSPCIEPILLGKLPGTAMGYMKASCDAGVTRLDRFRDTQRNPYEDESNKIPLSNGGFSLHD